MSWNVEFLRIEMSVANVKIKYREGCLESEMRDDFAYKASHKFYK